MKIIKFVSLSSSKEEYYSDYGPVKSVFEAKKFDDDKVEQKISQLKNSEFNWTRSILVKEYSDELNECQSKFKEQIDLAKSLFEQKGFKVDK